MRSQRSAAVGAERPRARTASYAHGRSASVACGLGQLKVALRPRSPSSQSGASRIEWKFAFSCREWMDCLVECEQLGSAGSLWCNMFSGRQQMRARERVFQRTLQSNTQDTLRDSLQGGTRFLFGFRGSIVYYKPTKPKTVGPGVVSLRLNTPKSKTRRETSHKPGRDGRIRSLAPNTCTTFVTVSQL